MQNIALIGMPGAGKSSVGKALAQHSCAVFVDSDQLIEQRQGAPLQQLLERYGYRALRQFEEQAICSLDFSVPRRHVIATGGSAVYSDAAMRHLRKHADIVYLEIDLPTMVRRIQAADEHQRGLARPENQSLEQLFEEREPLYRAAGCRTINCESLDIKQIVAMLQEHNR